MVYVYTDTDHKREKIGFRKGEEGAVSVLEVMKRIGREEDR